MQEIIDAFLNVANRRKVEYADVRVMTRRYEGLAVRDGRVDELAQSGESGFGVRVLHKGRWGFAGSRDVTATEAAAITEEAVRIAEASATAGGVPVRLDDTPPVQAEWATPVEVDPFAVGIEDKLNRLLEADGALRNAAGVSHSNAF